MCSDWEIRVFERALHSDFIVYLNHSLLQEDKEYVGNKPLAILIPPTFYPSQHTLLSGVVPSQARSDVLLLDRPVIAGLQRVLRAQVGASCNSLGVETVLRFSSTSAPIPCLESCF